LSLFEEGFQGAEPGIRPAVRRKRNIVRSNGTKVPNPNCSNSPGFPEPKRLEKLAYFTCFEITGTV
jgi:hypothetical protein